MIRYGGWFWLAFIFALPLIAFGWLLLLAAFAVGIVAVAITGRVVQPQGRHRHRRRVARAPIDEPDTSIFALIGRDRV